MITAVYSLLHFLVDGVCAVAMFGWFIARPDGYLSILFYNFCAFALQMPIGAVMDVLPGGERSREKSFVFALLGAGLTVAGAFTSPILLGIGNGFFHVGGGVGTIQEDREKHSRGMRLGVFVAPGAMGLALGRIIGKGFGAAITGWVAAAAIVMAVLLLLLLFWLIRVKPAEKEAIPAGQGVTGTDVVVLLGCFLVVILRSFVGMEVAFAWKTTAAVSLLSVVAVVLGKMLGGFLAAGMGAFRTALLTLLAAAVFYILSERLPAGLLALLFFNMTMPITLQQLVDRFPRLPGTMFGLLTVALFLGFLPTYFEMALPLSGPYLGAAGSLISAVILGMVIVKNR